MENRKVNIRNIIDIIVYILIFLTIPNTIIEKLVPTISDIIKIFSVASMTIYIIYIHIIKKVKFEKLDLYLFLFSLILTVITYIKGTTNFSNLFGNFLIFLIPIFIKDSLKRSDKLLKALYFLYIGIIVINFITMFFKIHIEWSDYSFIGGKNTISLTVVPAMLIISLYSLKKYKKVTTFNKLLLLLCIISLVISRSSTGIIVAILAIMYTVFLKKLKITFKKYLIIYIVIFILVIFGAPALENSFADKVMNELFGKSITFTNRTNLWEISLKYAKESPIIGYGRTNKIIFYETNGRLNEVHNMILELLLSGGILSVIMFISIIYKACNLIKEKTEKDNILLFYLFLYAIIGLVENVIYNYQLWLIIGLIYYYGKSTYLNDKIDEKGENDISNIIEHKNEGR